MRYISVENLREGMILGKTVYGHRGEILLMAGNLIKKEYVKRIKALGFAGLYIQDDFSKDIEIQELFRPELRIDTVNKLKEFYTADEGHNKNKKQTNLKEMQLFISNIVDEIIDNKDVIVNMIDLKVFDDYTYYHSVNVAAFAIAIGYEAGFNKKTLNSLGIAGILHDIGKKFIAKEILDKKGKLTDTEYDIVKEHTRLGYGYIKQNFDLYSVINAAILQHHERYDGSGYPLGKKEKEISAFARILAVADVYDALISERPYHDARLPHLALEFLISKSGTLFDPDVVRVFSKKIATYPIGIEVELSNGMKGLVVKNYEGFNARPLIKVKLENGEGKLIDLKNHINLKDVSIVKITS